MLSPGGYGCGGATYWESYTRDRVTLLGILDRCPTLKVWRIHFYGRISVWWECVATAIAITGAILQLKAILCVDIPTLVRVLELYPPHSVTNVKAVQEGGQNKLNRSVNRSAHVNIGLHSFWSSLFTWYRGMYTIHNITLITSGLIFYLHMAMSLYKWETYKL